MFNNYAIVQGCDHIAPVDVHLPPAARRGPRCSSTLWPELREQVKRNRKLTKGAREAAARAAEKAALAAPDIHAMKGLLA